MDFIIKNKNYQIAQRGSTYYFIVGKSLTGESIRKSLKTDNLEIAKERAKREYDLLLDAYATNLSNVNEKGFVHLAYQFLKENTYKKHREYMERLYIPYFGKTIGDSHKIKDVSKLTNKDLTRYLQFRRKVKTRSGDVVKNSTIQREKQTLVQFFKWCYENDYIAKQLMFPSTSIKETVRDEDGNPVHSDLSGRRDRFTDAEVELIFNQYEKEITNETNRHQKRRKVLAYQVCQFLLNTGMRPVCLRSLNWSKFEVQEDGSSIFHNVYSNKTKNKRDIIVSPKMTQMLLDLKKKQETFAIEHHLTFDPEMVNVFSLCNHTQEDGFEFKPVMEFDGGFRKLLVRCGIKGKYEKTLYSWRHTYISKMIEKDVPLKKIAAQCGTSVKVIEAYYDQSCNLIQKEDLYLEDDIAA